MCLLVVLKTHELLRGGWAGDGKNERSLIKNAICRKDDVKVLKGGSVVF